MKLSITRGGGVAGITTRTELDAGDLEPADAEAFMARARAVDLPDPGGLASPQPDETLYTVCLEDAGGRTEVHYTDGTLPEDVRELIAWADLRPERRERVGP